MSELFTASSRFIFLRGSPGTSKTAISKSVTIELKRQKRLAASFFFDKSTDRKGANSLLMLVSTLASQLSDFYPEYKVRLYEALEQYPNITRRPRHVQMQHLIINPFSSISLDSTALPSAIILDGLDECGGSGDLKELMQLVTSLSELPSGIVVLVSCRPEPEVLRGWVQGDQSPATYDTNDYPSETQTAILQYVRQRCEALLYESNAFYEDPEHSEIKDYPIVDLAQSCGGLFQLASVRIRKLELALGNSTFRQAFDKLMDEVKNQPASYESEYLAILRRAYLGERYSHTVLQDFRAVISGLLGAQSSLGLRALGALVGVDEPVVRALLKPLSSVVAVGGDHLDNIRFCHATFKEFLLGRPEGTEEDKKWFFFTQKEVESFMALQCFYHLNAELGGTRSMSDVLSKLTSFVKQYKHASATSNLALRPQEALIMRSAGDTARARAFDYAIYQWRNHFDPLYATPGAWVALQDFLQNNVLRWMELMAEMDRLADDEDMPNEAIVADMLGSIVLESLVS